MARQMAAAAAAAAAAAGQGSSSIGQVAAAAAAAVEAVVDSSDSLHDVMIQLNPPYDVMMPISHESDDEYDDESDDASDTSQSGSVGVLISPNHGLGAFYFIGKAYHGAEWRLF